MTVTCIFSQKHTAFYGSTKTFIFTDVSTNLSLFVELEFLASLSNYFHMLSEKLIYESPSIMRVQQCHQALWSSVFCYLSWSVTSGMGKSVRIKATMVLPPHNSCQLTDGGTWTTVHNPQFWMGILVNPTVLHTFFSFKLDSFVSVVVNSYVVLNLNLHCIPTVSLSFSISEASITFCIQSFFVGNKFWFSAYSRCNSYRSSHL